MTYFTLNNIEYQIVNHIHPSGRITGKDLVRCDSHHIDNKTAVLREFLILNGYDREDVLATVGNITLAGLVYKVINGESIKIPKRREIANKD